MSIALYAWGSNQNGQLGIGNEDDRVQIPTRVNGIPTGTDCPSLFKSGQNHTLIKCHSGTVYAAGLNTDRQLGYRPALTGITASTGVFPSNKLLFFNKRYEDIDMVAATATTTAYIINPGNKHNDTTEAWIITEGRGEKGELGRGAELVTTANMDTKFARVLWGTKQFDAATVANYLPGSVVDFAGGLFHYVAVLENGDVYGWGYARGGRLGDFYTGHRSFYSSPTKLNVPFRAMRAVCGSDFTYIVGTPASGDHIVFANENAKVVTDMPRRIRNWQDIGATWQDVFVLDTEGKMWSWGPSKNWKTVPDNLPPIERMAIGAAHVLVITRDNRLLTWGWATHGNCGEAHNVNSKGYITNEWFEIRFLYRISSIAAGASTSFAMIDESVLGITQVDIGEVHETMNFG